MQCHLGVVTARSGKSRVCSATPLFQAGSRRGTPRSPPALLRLCAKPRQSRRPRRRRGRLSMRGTVFAKVDALGERMRAGGGGWRRRRRAVGVSFGGDALLLAPRPFLALAHVEERVAVLNAPARGVLLRQGCSARHCAQTEAMPSAEALRGEPAAALVVGRAAGPQLDAAEPNDKCRWNRARLARGRVGRSRRFRGVIPAPLCVHIVREVDLGGRPSSSELRARFPPPPPVDAPTRVRRQGGRNGPGRRAPQGLIGAVVGGG